MGKDFFIKKDKIKRMENLCSSDAGTEPVAPSKAKIEKYESDRFKDDWFR